ncbi:MAG: sulfatase-like hydrolase/transferase [Pirellulales bacterium]
MNCICLVVDRLHSGYVGCYGNSWIATPALNRLAAEGFVFDQALVDGVRVEDTFVSLLTGSHVLERVSHPGKKGPTLPAILGRNRIRSTLISDDPRISRHPLAADFAELIELEAPREPAMAEDVGETHLAGFFATAADWLSKASAPKAAGPFCLWLHTQGMAAAWDAPLEMREQYADEDEPPPAKSAEVPALWLPEDYDPDELLAISQAYAGQVSLLDLCLGGLLDLVRGFSLGGDTLVVLVSARGFPLGIHRSIGAVDNRLYGELVQVPWLMRFPDGLGAAARSQALVQPCDLAATLLEYWHIEAALPSASGRSLLPVVREEAAEVRQQAFLLGDDGEQALRTPDWYLRRLKAASTADQTRLHHELYAKPDDRWEVNDVADRCADIAESLASVEWGEMIQASRAGRG